jgi:hypothetical protein
MLKINLRRSKGKVEYTSEKRQKVQVRKSLAAHSEHGNRKHHEHKL